MPKPKVKPVYASPATLGEMYDYGKSYIAACVAAGVVISHKSGGSRRIEVESFEQLIKRGAPTLRELNRIAAEREAAAGRTHDPKGAQGRRRRAEPADVEVAE